ncbi:hypothetical protein G6687_05825 [Polynucleobacter paneuropaeus]|jgi:hypothetical protein|nr:hypothetical protein [Polynucleobacter paneuropaeus]QWD24392.1 hypothetical protein G6687_05825 [Polynucleobacter paneuropaeus]QWD29527.1 hypothetical protein G6682_05770 [Polynucleobacter paneuropaeus]
MRFTGVEKLAAVSLIILIGGCQSVDLSPAKDNLTFVDTKSFDNEFATTLAKNKTPITIDFYSPIIPNSIPPRLEKWMAMAEAEGGKISVNQPPGELAPKDPLLLLGLFTGLWEVINKLRGQKDSYSMEESVKNRNVVINLARNPQGTLYINKVIFDPIKSK